MRIGVFDSGVGGLTFLKELIEKRPNNEYIYIGDTLNMPYGSKTKDELYSCVKKIMDYFVNEKVDEVIIACGTVSSTLYDRLKREYNINIIDAISPTINYINSSSYENIGVIATHNTINSHIFKNNLNKNVFEKELPLLASMIEQEDLSIPNYLDEEMKYFDDKNIDLLILGCTHYPVINAYFLSNGYNTLNMANPILERVSNDGISGLRIYFTKIDSTVIDNLRRILGNYKIEKIEL